MLLILVAKYITSHASVGNQFLVRGSFLENHLLLDNKFQMFKLHSEKVACSIVCVKLVSFPFLLFYAINMLAILPFETMSLIIIFLLPLQLAENVKSWKFEIYVNELLTACKTLFLEDR